MPAASLRNQIRRDIVANRGYPKSVVILLMFRLSHHLRTRRNPLTRILYIPTVLIYKLLSEWMLGVEIPAATKVGIGLRLRHGIGVVINPFVTIGDNVMIRQNVTLGNRYADDDVPVIGNDVEIGAGAIIIGRCIIGDRARIAAGAVVIHDVPPDGVAYPTAATIRPGRLATDQSNSGHDRGGSSS